MSGIKICAITTRMLTMKTFMNENLYFLSKKGFDVTIICSPNNNLKLDHLDNIRFIPLEMNHGIENPFSIVKNIYKLTKIFKKEKFDIIQYASSNAGLYSSIAGKIAKIKVRIFCQWGLLYIVHKGIYRQLLKKIEKITCSFSTVIQPDSFSNLDFAINQKLFKKNKGNIIWNGSACGIDLKKFNIDEKIKWEREILNKYNLTDDLIIYGFVGRLVKDKGINELLTAFLKIENENVRLFLIGPFDGVEKLDKNVLEQAKKDRRIIFAGHQEEVYKFISIFHFLILPSYREGFGMVLLEAAALGVPSIISNIRGPMDLIKDQFNGFLFEVKSSSSLLDTIKKTLCLDKKSYHNISVNAYNEAITKFDSNIFRRKLLEDRINLLGEK